MSCRGASAQEQTLARNTFEKKSVAFARQAQRWREVGAEIGCCKVKTGRGCWKRQTHYLCELHCHGNLTQRDSWRRAKMSTLILFGFYVLFVFFGLEMAAPIMTGCQKQPKDRRVESQTTWAEWVQRDGADELKPDWRVFYPSTNPVFFGGGTKKLLL